MREETKTLAENIVKNLNNLLQILKEETDKQLHLSNIVKNTIRDTEFGLCILSTGHTPHIAPVAIWICGGKYSEFNHQHFNKLSSIFPDDNLLCSQIGDSKMPQIKSSTNNTPLIPRAYLSYAYHSQFFVSINQNCSLSKCYILRAFLNRLWEIFDKLEWLESDKQKAFVKNFFDNFDFMNHYTELIFNEFTYLPTREILNEISLKNYEGQEIHAAIYFLSVNTINNLLHKGIKNIVIFNEACYIKDGMNEEQNESYVRKMLEMCNADDFYLIAKIVETPTGKVSYPAALIYCTETDIQFHDSTIKEMCIKFEARGIWQMQYRNETILKCKNNRYYIDDEMECDIWKNKLCSAIRDLPEEILSALVDTIASLKQLNHGALMILSNDAQDLADTLCTTYKRGTQIDAISLKNPDGRRLFARLSSIDGATLVDLDAQCHAFSVILDGEAKIEGDLGKGARHNSAKNYVANGNGRYAIVISEDKENDITIYPDYQISIQE